MGKVGGRLVRGLHAFFAASVWLVMTGGCGESGAAGDEDDACASAGVERGTAACQRWQAAVCNTGLRCEGGDRCRCMDAMSSIECVSDSIAEECAIVMEGLSCGAAAPAQCALDQVANRPWAQAGCADFVGRYCAAKERCDGVAAAACMQSVQGTGEGQIDCTRVLGLKPWFDDCLVALDAARCQDPDLPAACRDVLLEY